MIDILVTGIVITIYVVSIITSLLLVFVSITKIDMINILQNIKFYRYKFKRLVKIKENSYLYPQYGKALLR